MWKGFCPPTSQIVNDDQPHFLESWVIFHLPQPGLIIARPGKPQQHDLQSLKKKLSDKEEVVKISKVNKSCFNLKKQETQ